MSGLEQVAQDNQLFALGSRVVVRRVQPLFRQPDMILRLIRAMQVRTASEHTRFRRTAARPAYRYGFPGIILNLQAAEETGAADRLAFTGVGGEKDVRRT
jgi:hypothetical protein